MSRQNMFHDSEDKDDKEDLEDGELRAAQNRSLMGNRRSDSGECSYQRWDDEHEKLIETTTKKRK